MKATLFSRVPYIGPAPASGWPVPGASFSPDAALESVEAAFEQFELADQLGFDWITLAEHHYAPLSLTPNPTVMAGAVSQRVRRARIALLGANLPTLNPVRVAEEFAMVDVLTGGRLVAGMLRGTPTEYVPYGTNPAESRERFEEALSLVVRAWTEPQPFGWLGRYYEYRTISIWPRPVQQPHPPIFMSGSSPESGELAARHRLHLGLAFTTVPLARDAARHYRERARAAGWEPASDHVLYRLPVHVADTDERALEDLRTSAVAAGPAAYTGSNRAVNEAVASAGYYGRDAATQRGRLQPRALQERVALGQLLVGSPDTVLGQIRAIRGELDAGILDLNFLAISRDAIMRSIELFGTKVLPRIREL
jgi:alkanesulfonate monooxygenase SsuD/methylene tetrahydromethanopterin reductase-like flavin-dependent oxidoreductase (luciferase family)